MNSPEIKEFIREHRNLFWHTPEDKKEEISNNLKNRLGIFVNLEYHFTGSVIYEANNH